MRVVRQAALALAKMEQGAVGKPIADERLFDCVNVILSFQNADGGWATYENTRSYPILEVCYNHYADMIPPALLWLSHHQVLRSCQTSACQD